MSSACVAFPWSVSQLSEFDFSCLKHTTLSLLQVFVCLGLRVESSTETATDFLWVYGKGELKKRKKELAQTNWSHFHHCSGRKRRQ